MSRIQNHLPNKRHIGKQDPYCAVSLNGEKRRTKAIKRGGQHPEWDEEIRFTIFEDNDDILARTAAPDVFINSLQTAAYSSCRDVVEVVKCRIYY
jgi:hypothetical protein